MELIDVVDINDQVIGSEDRPLLNPKLLRHRIIHVLISDGQGKYLLQKRSDKVKFCPLHWSTAVGGFVRSGENYDQAAARECREELGIEPELTFLDKYLYQVPNGPQKFLSIYTMVFNGQFALDPEEVESVQYFSKDELINMIASGEKFHPELLFLLKKHFEEIN